MRTFSDIPGRDMVFLQYGFEDGLEGAKIAKNFVYILDIGVVSLRYGFQHVFVNWKMWKIFLYKQYTEIVSLRSGSFHDSLDVNCLRMFSGIPGKGMISLQYVFSYDALGHVYV